MKATSPDRVETFSRQGGRSGIAVKPRKLAALALLVLATGALLPGCGYPEVSPKTYALAKSLYAICNRKLKPKLDDAEELIADAKASGEISGREAGWLEGIVATAREGEWEEAAGEARQILADQVGREGTGEGHRH